ncbi:MAG: nucleotidyltransferase domain-containing protein [Thermodesulfobacteriota bacterium]
MSSETTFFRQAGRQRARLRQQALAERRERAWAVAHRGAALLRETFGANRVVLFGSLAAGRTFDERSDVDLVAWGLEERVYLRAISWLLDLDPTIPVDLLRGEELPEAIRAHIEEEGQPL